MIRRLFLVFIFIFSCSIINLYADMSISFINVGQGDAEFIVLPSSKTVLIDGGPDSEGLSDYIINHKISKIDYVVLTHPHSDHYKGLNYVFDNCQVNNFYDTRMNNSRATGDETVRNKALNEPECHIYYPKEGDKLHWDSEVDITVLNTCSTNTATSHGSELNESSIVLKLTYKGVSVLMTGDIDDTVETRLINQYGNYLQSQIYKVPHHGSKYSTNRKFIDKVKPEYAVIEVGQNSYGHPTEIAIKQLKNVDAQVSRTDIDGTITFTINTTGKIINYVEKKEGL